MGPNGAGKSTTMRMIVDLDRPSSGTATIGGRRYHELRHPLRTVGALFDAKQVHPDRTARNHLRWIAASNRLPAHRMDDVLAMVGLSDVAGKKAGTFSLGMSQRLGIAAALLGDPSVLILDEPINGLDPEGIHWVRTLMRKLADEGRTVFVSSHLLAEMGNTADRLVVIGRGRLIAATTSTEFVTRAGADIVCVRSPRSAALREVLIGGLIRKLFADRQLGAPDKAVLRILSHVERSPDAVEAFVARVDGKALAVLSRSFVDLKCLPTQPDMSKLFTEEFLPKK